MKIGDISLFQGRVENRPGQAGQNSGVDFGKVLARAGSGQVQGKDGGTSSTTGASTIGLDPAGTIMAAGLKTPVAQVEEALNLLDRFAEALADPEQSPKQMQGLVKDLEREAGRLAELSRDLPADHDLKSLVDQTAVLAAVEAAKFNRGDYV
ncbi:MAG: hypothetical protein KKB20_23420 [Proteobacteria bacterium]|nr:hypothetical protein [Pseudomonadota bacterium]